MIIVAKHTLLPEYKEEFLNLVKELVDKSRAEAGNVFYKHVQSTDDENVYSFIEGWKDQAAIDSHMQEEYFKRIAKRLEEITASFEIEVFNEYC